MVEANVCQHTQPFSLLAAKETQNAASKRNVLMVTKAKRHKKNFCCTLNAAVSFEDKLTADLESLTALRGFPQEFPFTATFSALFNEDNVERGFLLQLNHFSR